MTEVREETVIFYLMAENGDLEECIMAFDRNIESKDMGVVAACIMGIDHMIRRFDFFYKEGYHKIIEKYDGYPDAHIQGVISEMNDYIESFVKK